MYTELLDYLRTVECFIEAEGKPSSMNNFISKYNLDYHETLSVFDDGIILLQDDANKWGLELRLYVRDCPPVNVRALGFTHNDAYRNDFSYRLNSNEIVRFLFDQGYRIGIN